MEVILCQDVGALGKIGDVVQVKSGHARNYLLPKKLAFAATPANLKRIELQRAQKIESDRKAKEASEQQAEKLSKVSLTLNVEVNDLEKLYGSITDTEVVNALAEEGFEVDKKDVVFENPIEDLGIFDIGIRVQKDVVAKVKLWVTKK